MTIRYLDQESQATTPKMSTSKIRYLEPETPILKSIGQGALKGITNIPTELSKTGEGLNNIIGQTIGNVAVSPKYALKTAVSDIGSLGTGIVDLGKKAIGTGYKMSALNPNIPERLLTAEKAVTDMGKYLQENLASTAFDILTLSPKANVIKGTIKKIDELSEKFVRRGLGFSKEMIKPIGAKATANKVAGELLKRDLIPSWGSTEKTYNNVLKLKNDTGAALGEIRSALHDSGVKSFSPIDLDDRITTELKKQYTTAGDRNALNEIRKLVLSQGDGGPLTFADATELVQTLQSKGGFKKGLAVTDTVKPEMYRDAAKIAREMNDNAALEAAKKMKLNNLYQDYMTIKDVYRKSEIAFDGIEDLRALQATDKHISVINNPLTKDILNRAFLGGGKVLFKTSKVAGAVPVKTLYYSGRLGQLGVNPKLEYKGGK